MRQTIEILALFVVGLFFVGCSSTTSIQINRSKNESHKLKHIVLCFDGTGNDRDSRTNISTLSEIIKHQDKDNLYMYYNEGPGTGGRALGAATGWGTDPDVAEAYAFLTKYYSSERSKLYIFGFSRGAYASRILAGMIYSVGIYDLNTFSQKERINIATKLYKKAYKGKGKEKIQDIREDAQKIIKTYTNKLAPNYNVEIEVMGLWDTVEALGVIPTIEAAGRIVGIVDPQEIVEPNDRYVDQICNIKHVFHALSLDDNRSYVFTPIIISSKDVVAICSENNPEKFEGKKVNEKKKRLQEAIEDKVEEVWFSGAHSDIGGGYKINELNEKDEKDNKQIAEDVAISGVSLNWMISRIKKVAPDLLPANAQVFENPLGYIHDAENGSLMYARQTRNSIIGDSYYKYSLYTNIEKDQSFPKIKIHHSVIDRIEKTPEEKKAMGFDSRWYMQPFFEDCFKELRKKNCYEEPEHKDCLYKFKKCDVIEIVNN